MKKRDYKEGWLAPYSREEYYQTDTQALVSVLALLFIVGIAIYFLAK